MAWTKNSKILINFLPTLDINYVTLRLHRSSPPESFSGKSVLKMCSKFTGKHSCQSAISIEFQSNVIEITLRHGCSAVNLLHIFRTPFPWNTSGRLLLVISVKKFQETLFIITEVDNLPIPFWSAVFAEIG